jgi:hypothetical protein
LCRFRRCLDTQFKEIVPMRLESAITAAASPAVPARRHSRLALVAGLLAVLLIALAATPARASPPRTMRIFGSSHCLDNALEDWSKLQMWSCGDGAQKRWYVVINGLAGAFTIINERTGDCMTWAAAMDGCNTAAAFELWNFYYTDPAGWFLWRNVGSGLCLQTSSVANGTALSMGTCDPAQSYQRWSLD